MLALPVLLGICHPSLWSPLFPLRALALILLSLVKVRLSHTLTLSPLMISYSRQTALFLFLLAKAAPAYLGPRCSAVSVALKPLFPFQPAQYVQVFPLKPAPFCMLFAGLTGSVTCALGNPLQSLSSYLSYPLFSFLGLEVTVSLKFFDTQVLSISTEELVHPRYVLIRLRCNGHSLLLGSYLSRIGRIENPSCIACGHSSQDISHLILHGSATDFLYRSLFGDSLSLYGLWSRTLRVAQLLGLHGLPPCLHPLGGVSLVRQPQAFH